MALLRSQQWLRVGLCIMLGVGAYGIYRAFNVVRLRNHLVEHGLRSEATITAVFKEKCGYGYGYSANFTYTVDDKVFNGHCDCESREWVREGDRYTVAYDPMTPENAQLIVDQR